MLSELVQKIGQLCTDPHYQRLITCVACAEKIFGVIKQVFDYFMVVHSYASNRARKSDPTKHPRRAKRPTKPRSKGVRGR